MQILQLVLSGIFTLGLWAMAVRGLHGERATVGVLFSQVSKVWKYVAQSIAIAVGVFLLVAPIILLVFLAFIYLFLRGGAAAEHTRAVQAVPEHGLVVPGRPSSRLRRTAGLAAAVIVIAGMFALMPRIGGAGGLGMYAPGEDPTRNRSRVGFSDQVRHGSFGAIAGDAGKAIQAAGVALGSVVRIEAPKS